MVGFVTIILILTFVCNGWIAAPQDISPRKGKTTVTSIAKWMPFIMIHYICRSYFFSSCVVGFCSIFGCKPAASPIVFNKYLTVLDTIVPFFQQLRLFHVLCTSPVNHTKIYTTKRWHNGNWCKDNVELVQQNRIIAISISGKDIPFEYHWIKWFSRL